MLAGECSITSNDCALPALTARIFQELRTYRELTAAEFDALQASAPAIRDGCLRRLRAAMGDTRGGERLVEEWEADRWPIYCNKGHVADNMKGEGGGGWGGGEQLVWCYQRV